MFMFIKKKEVERDPEVMRGRAMVEARFAIFAGIYPDFYGWRYYYFVIFLLVIHPGIYSYYLIAYYISFYYGLKYMDIELLGQVLCLGTITIIYGSVSVFYMAKKSDIDELMKMVGRGLSNYSRPMTQQDNSIMERMVRGTHKYAIGSSILLCLICVMHLGLLPVFRGLKGQYTSITNQTAPINKYTPLPVWTPYECNSLSLFIVSYFTQVLPGCLECAIINACCILFIGFSQQLSGNLEILCYSLRDLPTRALHMFENEDGEAEKATNDLYKNDHFLRCINACMAENIQHHMNIIEFYKKFQKVVGFSILAIFSGTGLVISTAAYSMLLIADGGGEMEMLLTSMFVWFFDLFVFTFLLTMYCYYGQKVTDRSEEIFPALYDTPWLEADMSFRRSVLIAMSYSKTTMGLTAMGLVRASHETLIDIIKTSFSYLNMLLAAR